MRIATWARGIRLLALGALCACLVLGGRWGASLAAENPGKPEREAVAPWMAAALAEVEAAKAALAKTPDDWRAHVRHGDALARIRLWEEAEAAYRSADATVRNLADLAQAEKDKVAAKVKGAKQELATIEWAQNVRMRLAGNPLKRALHDKLRELGAGPRISMEEQAGTIVGIDFTDGGPRTFAPLRGLPLRGLHCPGMTADDLVRLHGLELASLSAPGLKTGDLSPLRLLPLRRLAVNRSPALSDLRGVRGLQLESLDLSDCEQLESLEGVEGMPLTRLVLMRCHKLRNLDPLRGRPLERLHVDETAVSDLAPLKGMPLTVLTAQNTRLSDLGPLEGMKLTTLHFEGFRVRDLTPLKGMPLASLRIGAGSPSPQATSKPSAVSS